MKTQDAPNLLDRAKQKIKRLEDALEQAEAEVELLGHEKESAHRQVRSERKLREQAEAERDELFRKWSASSSNREKDLEAKLKATEKVVEAAKARFKVWTRETYVALDDALAELEEVK